MTLTIAPESPLSPDAVELVRQARAVSAALYPPASNHGLDVTALLEDAIRFLVARLDGEAVGCGAVRLGPDGSAEIKGMFVTAAARGQGVGMRLLEAVERRAHEAGTGVVRLETGIASAAALGLYRRAGYRERPPFGGYVADPLSVFMEKKTTGGPLEATAGERQ